MSETMSYDTAMIDNVVAFEEAATGSKLVTLLGIGFGAVNASGYSVRVRLGQSASEVGLFCCGSRPLLLQK